MSNGRSALGERSVSPETEELGLHARIDLLKRSVADADFSPQGDGIALVAKMAILTTKLAEIRRHREEATSAPPVEKARRDEKVPRKSAKTAPSRQDSDQSAEKEPDPQSQEGDERVSPEDASHESRPASASGAAESSAPNNSSGPPAASASARSHIDGQPPPQTREEVLAQVAAIKQMNLSKNQKYRRRCALWKAFEQQKKDAGPEQIAQPTANNLLSAQREPASSPCVQASLNKQEKQPEYPVDVIEDNEAPAENVKSSQPFPQPDNGKGKGKAKVSNDETTSKSGPSEKVSKAPKASPVKGRLLSQALRPTPERTNSPVGGETSASGAKRNMSQYDRFYLDNYVPQESRESERQISAGATDGASSKQVADQTGKPEKPTKSTRAVSVIELGTSSEEQSSSESAGEEEAEGESEAEKSKQEAPKQPPATKDDKVTPRFNFGFDAPQKENQSVNKAKKPSGRHIKHVETEDEAEKSDISWAHDVAYNLTLAKTTTPRTQAGPLSRMLARSRDSTQSQQQSSQPECSQLQASQPAKAPSKAPSKAAAFRAEIREGLNKSCAAKSSNSKSQAASKTAAVPKPSSALGSNKQKSQPSSSAPATFNGQPGEASATKFLREFVEAQAQVRSQSDLPDSRTSSNEPQGKRRKRASSAAAEHVEPHAGAPSQVASSPAKASSQAGPPAKKQKTSSRSKKADAVPSSQQDVGANGLTSSPYSGVANHIGEIFKLTGQYAPAAAPVAKPAKRSSKKSMKQPTELSTAGFASHGNRDAVSCATSDPPPPTKTTETTKKKSKVRPSSKAKAPSDDGDETSSSGVSDDSDCDSSRPLAESAKKRAAKRGGRQSTPQTEAQKSKSPTQKSSEPKPRPPRVSREAYAATKAAVHGKRVDETETLSDGESSDSGDVSSESFVPNPRESGRIDDPKTPVTRSSGRFSSPPPRPQPTQDTSTQAMVDRAEAAFQDALSDPKSKGSSSGSSSQGSKNGSGMPGQKLAAVYVSPREMPSTQALVDGVSHFPSSADKPSTGFLGSAKKWFGFGGSQPAQYSPGFGAQKPPEKASASASKSHGQATPRRSSVATASNAIPVDPQRTRITTPAAPFRRWRSPPAREMTVDTDFEPLPAFKRPPVAKGTQTTPRIAATPRSILKRPTPLFGSSSMDMPPPQTPRSSMDMPPPQTPRSSVSKDKGKGKAPLSSPFATPRRKTREEEEDQEAIDGAIDFLQTPDCIKTSSSLGLTQAAGEVARAGGEGEKDPFDWSPGTLLWSQI